MSASRSPRRGNGTASRYVRFNNEKWKMWRGGGAVLYDSSTNSPLSPVARSRVELPPPSWFPELFPLLLNGQDLPSGRVTEAIRDLVAGRVDPARGAAFLT